MRAKHICPRPRKGITKCALNSVQQALVSTVHFSTRASFTDTHYRIYRDATHQSRRNRVSCNYRPLHRQEPSQAPFIESHQNLHSQEFGHQPSQRLNKNDNARSNSRAYCEALRPQSDQPSRLPPRTFCSPRAMARTLVPCGRLPCLQSFAASTDFPRHLLLPGSLNTKPLITNRGPDPRTSSADRSSNYLCGPYNSQCG